MRKKVKKSKDKAIFKRTAAKGKAVNLMPTTYRGGIRF